ncbi:MAG TPA: hypothetical protein VID27_15045 [Blastocatellia bacterium]|jgi:hypothetical protein
MNLDTLKKRPIGSAMMVVLTLGVMAMAGATAQAQFWGRDDYRDRGRWSSSRTKEYAHAFGYFLAYPEGREHYRRGDRIDYEDVQLYRDDTNGYLGWMGDRNDYRSSYRRGFQLGFKEGRDGRSPRITRRDVERILGGSLREVYGRDYRDRDWRDHDDRRDRDDWRDDDRGRGRYNRDQIIRFARENGYRDGFQHGQQDRRNRRGYNFECGDYRNGTRGYRSEYSDRELYRQAYREGHRRGYDDGYRGRNSGWRF